MTFKETIKTILNSSSRPLTPQEIRSIVKEDYPDFYGTTSHQINVQKGHYTDLDHALLAQLYSLVRNNDCFFCDTNFKPMKITLKPNTGIKNKKIPIPGYFGPF